MAMDYCEILNYSFKKHNSTALINWHRKLCIVPSDVKTEGLNLRIWCAAGDKGVCLYDEECNLLTTIHTDEVNNIHSVAEVDGNALIVCNASVNDGCLLQLDATTGSLVGKLVGGCFSDVTYSRESRLIYAVESQLRLILVFENIQGSWMQVKVLKNVITDPLDTVCVAKELIYVCYHRDRQLRIYSLDGELLHQTRTKGASQLLSPRLCGVDDHGNALVCDWMNHKVHVYSRRHDTWAAVRAAGLQYPVDVSPAGGDGRGLYVLQHGVMGSAPNQLLKFTADS